MTRNILLLIILAMPLPVAATDSKQAPAAHPLAESSHEALAPFTDLLARQPVVGRALHKSAADLLAKASALTDSHQLPASMVMLSYHQSHHTPKDLIAQVFRKPSTDARSAFNSTGVMRAQFGADLLEPGNRLINLLYHPVDYLGSERSVGRFQRAFESSIRGDLTFLRELTVEPLHVIALVPEAQHYLPRSMRDRVESVIVEMQFSFGEWRSEVSFLAADGKQVDDVAFIVAAWRELVVHLVDNFAGYRTGQDLRSAIYRSDVQVEDQRVVASMNLPAMTALRVTHELIGHGSPSRLTICHEGRTVTIDEQDLPFHLEHGDIVGECPLSPIAVEAQ